VCLIPPFPEALSSQRQRPFEACYLCRHCLGCSFSGTIAKSVFRGGNARSVSGFPSVEIGGSHAPDGLGSRSTRMV
jgi:hypothetical protein